MTTQEKVFLQLLETSTDEPEWEGPVQGKAIPKPETARDGTLDEDHVAVDLESVWAFNDIHQDRWARMRGKGKTSYREVEIDPPEFVGKNSDHVCNYSFKVVPFLSQGSFTSFEGQEENDRFKYPLTINGNYVDDLIDEDTQHNPLPSASFETCAETSTTEEIPGPDKAIEATVLFADNVFTHKRKLEVFGYPTSIPESITYSHLALTNHFLQLAIKTSNAIHHPDLVVRALDTFLKFIQKGLSNSSIKTQLFGEELLVRFMECTLELHKVVNASMHNSFSSSMIDFYYITDRYGIITDQLLEEAAAVFCGQLDVGGCFLKELVLYQALVLSLEPHSLLDLIDKLADFIAYEDTTQQAVYLFCEPFNSTDSTYAVTMTLGSNMEVELSAKKYTEAARMQTVFPIWNVYDHFLAPGLEGNFAW